MSEAPIVTAVLLLTDAVDSTRMAQDLGDAEAARHWAAHDRIARDLLERWRGREIDKADGLLALFSSAADALGFARDLQRGLARNGLPLLLRVGLHVGPVLLRENSAADIARGAKPLEVEGLAKSIAARVMSAAPGGEIYLTAEALASLDDHHRAKLPLRAIGHWRLQGLTEPMALHQLIDVERPFAPPVDRDKAYQVVRQGDLWRPLRDVPNNLPLENNRFVDRHEVMHAITRRFDEGSRLITVTGMGGMGKTRLLLRSAWSLLGKLSGGAWFCDLTQATDRDGLLRAVAQALDVPLGRGDAAVQLGRAIAARGPCCILLDNFEQVAGLAPVLLVPWMSRAPQARFMVSSRELLGLPGEVTMTLEPLPTGYASELFIERASAAHDGFTLQPGDERIVEELVQVIDCLPLAIELAAARSRVMTPATMLRRMNERFALLGTGKGREGRQATLRAAIDWSWDLLTLFERAMLAQLSVFSGGFTLQAAEAVIDVGPGAPRVMDLLQSLVDKSLVRALGRERFDLLHSVRVYATERLASTEGQALVAARTRHAHHFARLGPKHAITQRCVEVDNLITACRYAVALGDGAMAAACLRCAAAALQLRGPFRTLLEVAQEVSRMPQLAGAPLAEVTLLAAAAHLLCGQGQEAAPLFEVAASGARRLGGRDLAARAVNGLAGWCAQSGHVERAAELYAEALSLLDVDAEADSISRIFNAYAAFEESHGRHDVAKSYQVRALQVATAAGDRRWEGGSAGNLGTMYTNEGQYDLARPLFARSIEIAREIGDRQWEANGISNLGLIDLIEGQPTSAQAHFEAACALASDMGHIRLLAIVRCNLGLAAQELGQLDAAQAHHEAALALARELADRRSEGQFLSYLGRVHTLRGRFDQARNVLAEGQSLLDAMGDAVSLGILHCHRAEVEQLAGLAEQARAHLAWAEQLAAGLSGLTPKSEFGQALHRVRALMPADAATGLTASGCR